MIFQRSADPCCILNRKSGTEFCFLEFSFEPTDFFMKDVVFIQGILQSHNSVFVLVLELVVLDLLFVVTEQQLVLIGSAVASSRF